VINWFLEKKTNIIKDSSSHIFKIEPNYKVLFSLFTRYGDTIISLAVIKEFIEKYRHVEFLIICPHQMKPYVDEFLPNIKCIGVNKRNLFDLFKTINFLKKWQPDIGYNPWSTGHESCYFLTFSKKFFCYKNFHKPASINHYDVVRLYLNLEIPKWSIDYIEYKEKLKSVLICPQSTDENRSMGAHTLDRVLSKLKNKGNSKITIAAMDRAFSRESYDFFPFMKTSKSSSAFIKCIKKHDIVIAVDSAPLHIALALKKPIAVFFYTTKESIVINSKASLINNTFR